MKNTARIMDIKHFAVHDGDGIRTTVFFKGCPLRCVWCHNPEGLSLAPSLSYIEKKCIMCGECVSVCENNVHTFDNSIHIIQRDKCVACGKCENACLGDALRIYGNEMTVEQVLSEVLKDKEFYLESGGGVTLSGGECLLQWEFCRDLLNRLKENGISTAVDTCGAVPWKNIEAVIPFTDIFLYDVKAYGEEVHKNATGCTNKQILDNLKHLDRLGCKTEIRIPFVPEYNMCEMEKIAQFLSTLSNITKVKILPYHNLAGSKYHAIGIENHILPEKLPTAEQIEKAKQIIKEKGITVA